MAVVIKQEECVGCGACASTCPFGAIDVNDGKALITDSCTMCGACIKSCPVGAIFREEAEAAAKAAQTSQADQYNGVWVYLEQFEGELLGVGLELLNPARKMADELKQELAAVIIGNNVEALAAQAFAYGADKAYVVDGPEYAHYTTDAYALAFVHLIKKYKPNALLLGATSDGRDLGPRVAGRMGTGLCADCTNLGIDKETHLVAWTRPAFGGNIMATIFCPDRRPQMGTVRPKVFKLPEADFSRSGTVIRENPPVTPDAIRTRFVDFLRVCGPAGCNIEDADIIVAAGRGIGKQENMKLVKDLADALGGVVGASRPIVEAEWMPASAQVGQTGKTVSSRLYIACGISGAIQHIAGMSSSDIIVAINKDPNAPIFRIADIGIIGDVTVILPALTQEIRARRDKTAVGM